MARGFASIGLLNPKSNKNVASVLRAAACYEVALLAVSGHRYTPMTADTCRTYRHIPFLNNVDDLFSVMPYGSTPIAVEINDNAKSLINFVHPPSAYYIFGPEDGSLNKEVLSKCKVTVMIPTKFCMNLAATVNVVLYDRMAKNHNKYKNE